jgi:hypothetical protein
MEKSTSVARQSMESRNNSLQKKASRSTPSTRTSTSTNTNTNTNTTAMGWNGHSTGSVNDERVGMELEQSELVTGQSVEKSGSTYLQKEE